MLFDQNQKDKSEGKNNSSFQDFIENQLNNQLFDSNLSPQARCWQFQNQYYDFFKSNTFLNLLPNQNTFSFENQQKQLHIQTEKTKRNLAPDKSQIKLKLYDSLSQSQFYIQQDQNSFNARKNKFSIKLIKQTPEVVQIQCQLCKYRKIYKVLLQSARSCRHSNQILGIGSFGTIYFRPKLKIMPKSINSAIKCLNFNSNNWQVLKFHIKQFFLADMMSSLQIGPKILKSQGFDFIIFENCLQFEMQVCSKESKQNLESNLKENLFKMHLLNAVHSDLKPSNVMYSTQFCRNVFLDYGTAQILKQSLGQKSLSGFKGTYEFCSNQMKLLVSKKKKYQIDLYKNDVVMLVNTIKAFNQKQGNQDADNLKKQAHYCTSFDIQQIIIELKFHLYFSQFNYEPTESYKQFINFFYACLDQSIQTSLILLATDFTKNLNRNSLRILKQYFISLNQKLYKMIQQYQFNIFVNQKSLAQDDAEEFQPNFKHIFHKLFEIQQINLDSKSSQEIQEIQSFTFQKNSEKTKLVNLQFILLKEEYLKKLDLQQYFSLFVQFTSFWNNQLIISIQNKILAAQILQSQIKKQKSINSKYISIDYLPDQKYSKNVLFSLVFCYGYLLSYCMESQSSQFKLKYMMTVLKNCILLNFKYYKFVCQCFQNYFNYLLKQKNNFLISIGLSESVELVYLTKCHYLIVDLVDLKQNQTYSSLYQRKEFGFSLKRVLQDLIVGAIQSKHDNHSSQNNKFWRQKIEILSKIWLLFNNAYCIQDKFTQQEQSEEIHTLTKQVQRQIQNQFEYCHRKLQRQRTQQEQNYLQIYYKTIGLFKLYLIQQNYNIYNNFQKQKPIFNYLAYSISNTRQEQKQNFLNQFYYIQNENYLMCQFSLQIIDKRIGCIQISRYLFFKKRRPYQIKSQNSKKLQSIFDLIISYPQCHFLNPSILMGTALTTHKSDFQQITLPLLQLQQQQKFYNLKKTFIQIDVKLCKIFSLDFKQTLPLILRHLQIMIQKLNQQQLAQLIDRKQNILMQLRQIFNPENVNGITISLGNFLSFLAKQIKNYPLYIKYRKNIYHVVLKLTKQYNLNFQKTGICSYQFIKNSAFFEYRDWNFSSHFSISQFVKAWNCHKLRLIITQQQETTTGQHFQILYNCLWKKQNLLNVAIFLINCCAQIYSFGRNQDLIYFCQWMQSLHQLQFETKSIFCLEMLSILQNYPLHPSLFPFLFQLLYYQKQLKKNIQVWEILFKSVCVLFAKFKQTRWEIQRSLKEINQQILFLTLRFLRKSPQQKTRQIFITRRKLVKNFLKQSHFQRFSIINEITKYLSHCSINCTKKKLFNEHFQSSLVQRLRIKMLNFVKNMDSQFTDEKSISKSTFKQHHCDVIQQEISQAQRILKFYKYQERLQAKFCIKDIFVLKLNHCIVHNYKQIQQSPSLSFAQKENYFMGLFENKIKQMKQSEQFRDLEETYDTINEIIDLQQSMHTRILAMKRSQFDKDQPNLNQILMKQIQIQ